MEKPVSAGVIPARRTPEGWKLLVYRDTAPYAGGKIARYYVAVTKQERITLPVSEELGRPEHDEGRWVSIADAERLLPPRLQPILGWVREVLATNP